MSKYFQCDNPNKEQDLAEKWGAKKTTKELAKSYIDHDTLIPVCVVDNGFFQAAALIYNQGEFEAFSIPTDNRPKRWYIIERETAKNIFQ